jgi:hypothetical protein
MRQSALVALTALLGGVGALILFRRPKPPSPPPTETPVEGAQNTFVSWLEAMFGAQGITRVEASREVGTGRSCTLKNGSVVSIIPVWLPYATVAGLVERHSRASGYNTHALWAKMFACRTGVPVEEWLQREVGFEARWDDEPIAPTSAYLGDQ